MSWQLGAFAVLALALASGFAWYERARPDARIVALVGTLAALAALGRIAFAPIPNVKPTTDIVLFSGYALGGGPGFVVGALAGLTSNFFFGQGPWTPWQMAAWGATGVLGAGLARASARPLGRWTMAVVCAVIGFLFTAVQDVGDWVNYSDHSAAQLGVYVGKGVGFDFVHAAGCFAFALAFGPSLTRSISRFAARAQVTWSAPPGAAVPAIIGLLSLGVALGGAPAARAGATPTDYLLSAQNSDGGFGGAPGSSSSQLFSGWAALGLAAEGHNPRDVRHGARSALDYIGGGWGSDVGSLERTVLVVSAAGASPHSFGGQDLVGALQGDVRADGSVADQVNLTSFGVLAFRAAGVSPAGSTLSWLVRQQDRDGGFNFGTAGATSDVDDTGAVLEALAGAGGVDSVRAQAAQFIRAQQNSDGGFPSQPGADSNAQSTAWAVQGLLAAGVDPGSLHRGGASSPFDYLGSLTASDGHVQYSRASDQTPVWVTAQVAMALVRKPLPLAAVGRRTGATRTARSGGGATGKAPASSRRRARHRHRQAAHRSTAAAVPASSVVAQESNALAPGGGLARTAGGGIGALAAAFVAVAAVLGLLSLWWHRRRAVDSPQ
jgi:energy-coupling factor transport system substrate-specific component